MKPIFGALALCALPMAAQATCLPYEALRQSLIDQGIRLEGTGMVRMLEGQGAVQLWMSRDGTWAIFGINQIGIACLLVAGEGWTTPERA